MTRTEKQMVQNLDPNMKQQAVTIIKAEKIMRRKVKELLPVFEEMAVSQTVTNTQGEEVIKSNPAFQEVRATIRDYCTIVKVEQDILANRAAPVEVITPINELRRKLKIVNE